MKPNRFFRLAGISSVVALASLGTVAPARAGSGTWLLNPGSSDWNRAANWSSRVVPNGAADVATFDVSNQTNVSLSAPIVVDAIVFNSGASSFTITCAAGVSLGLDGAGVINNSGITQSFVTAVSASSRGSITFSGIATAGSSTTFLNKGGPTDGTVSGETDFLQSSTAANGTFVNNASSKAFVDGGSTQFFDSASAANGAFTNNGSAVLFALGGSTTFSGTSTAANGVFTNAGGVVANSPGSGGSVVFNDDATAAESSLTNQGGAVAGGNAGFINFHGNSTAGKGSFTNGGATASDATSGQIAFFETSSAGSATFINNPPNVTNTIGLSSSIITLLDNSKGGTATFTNNGGQVSGAGASGMLFENLSQAMDATLIANGGVNGAMGAFIHFLDKSSGGRARLEVFGNGNLDISDISPVNRPDVTIGSIEGDGLVFLGSHNLSIGGNNLSTTFSGVAADGGGGGGSGGSLSKTGAGTLTLSGANIYTGGTTVTAGALVVSNRTGSATGPGNVTVNGGTLGGGGIIAGAVTVGIGGGAGATLQPSYGSTKKVALTIQSLLTFKADATYTFRLRSRAAEVIANGVTIESGAQFKLLAPDRDLPAGISAIVISNTSATPIVGTFANLPDGGTITAGSNTFQASYEGGDGNDLTLTVIP